ncbi:MAG: sensor histidine kinase [Actinomycetota bacterium]|nr:sensor histidine kinase [Actinomycetota bacterium]
MRTETPKSVERSLPAFRHEALFYAGTAEFVDRTASFIRDAVDAEEPIHVVVGAEKIDRLREALDADAKEVRFADMADVGQNPARIIPAWRAFVSEHAGSARRFRGVGEPIWASRSPDELVECERHEALLNLAFTDAPAWWLVCPYDKGALESSVIEEAQRNHPFVSDDGVRRESGTYRGLEEVAQPFDLPLPEPDVRPDELDFGKGDLHAVRRFIARHAAASGLDPARAGDLLLAADELVANSVRHAGGRGVLRIWQDGDALLCEVRDSGRIDLPLAGREQPAPTQESGFGMWLVNNLCDLVQVRTFPSGSVVRLHIARGSAA